MVINVLELWLYRKIASTKQMQSTTMAFHSSSLANWKSVRIMDWLSLQPHQNTIKQNWITETKDPNTHTQTRTSTYRTVVERNKNQHVSIFIQNNDIAFELNDWLVCWQLCERNEQRMCNKSYFWPHSLQKQTLDYLDW